MTQIKGWSLTSDLETFRQGATAYRNGREWAKTQRDHAIAQANEKVTVIGTAVDSQSDVSRSTRETLLGDTSNATSQDTSKDLSLPLRYDPDTSEDELSFDYSKRPAKRSRSPEKQAIEPIQDKHGLDQRSKGVLSVSKPNAFKDGRKFNLTPENQAQDEKL